jgi:hypothetical protein
MWWEGTDMALFSRKPNMKKMFDGRNMATRPIPVEHDTGTDRAIAVAASEQQPKHKAVNMPSGPRVAGADAVFGTKVAGATPVRGGTYNPATGRDGTI